MSEPVEPEQIPSDGWVAPDGLRLRCIADQVRYWIDFDKRDRDRHGLTTTAETHIVAPPARGQKRRTALEVLGLASGASAADIEAAYREKAKTAHPDKAGGSAEAMAELNAARSMALRSVK